MSEEKVTLELLGARLLTLSANVQDVQLRLTSLEGRFTTLENRYGVQEERINRLIALVVRVAERLDGAALDDRIKALEKRLRSLEERTGPRGAHD